MSYKLKRIGLALTLMASLLVGSGAACPCSHHHEEAEAAETSCHGSYHGMENAEASTEGDAVDAVCVCFVNQSSPAIASKSESKKLKSGKSTSNSDRLIPDFEHVTTIAIQQSSPEFGQALSYSNALRSLLPSRAPPRL